MRGLGSARIHRHAADQRGAAAAAVPGPAAGAAGRPARERRRGPRPLPDHPAGGPGGDPAGLPHPDHGLRRHLPGPDDRGQARPSGAWSATATSCRCRPSRTCTAATRPPTPTAGRIDLLLPVGNAAGWAAARHGRRPRGGGARLPLPDDPTRGDPLVPRPPHGLHRPARLPRTGRASTSCATTRRTRCRCRAASASCPLMICDRAFAADGSFRYPALDPRCGPRPGCRAAYMAGVLGDVVLVNGAPWPVHEVDAARYRLRILNASNARRFELALDPPPRERPPVRADRLATAGCSPRRSARERSTLAPAERFDVVVDFARVPVGTEVTMVNSLGVGPTAAGDAVPRRPLGHATTAPVPERARPSIEALVAAPRPSRPRTFAVRRRGDAGAGAHAAGRSTAQPFDPDRTGRAAPARRRRDLAVR